MYLQIRTHILAIFLLYVLICSACVAQVKSLEEFDALSGDERIEAFRHMPKSLREEFRAREVLLREESRKKFEQMVAEKRRLRKQGMFKLESVIRHYTEWKKQEAIKQFGGNSPEAKAAAAALDETFQKLSRLLGERSLAAQVTLFEKFEPQFVAMMDGRSPYERQVPIPSEIEQSIRELIAEVEELPKNSGPK